MIQTILCKNRNKQIIKIFQLRRGVLTFKDITPKRYLQISLKMLAPFSESVLSWHPNIRKTLQRALELVGSSQGCGLPHL